MMAVKVLFVDCDGVLNDHHRMRNGYCQLKPKLVKELCRILDADPEIYLIFSSAWRYLPLCNDCFNPMMEAILILFGAPYKSIHNRVIGRTERDEETCARLGLSEDIDTPLDYGWLKENGTLIRREQILKIAGFRKFCVLDDLDIEMPELLQTEPKIGLTREIASKVLTLLGSSNDRPEPQG